MNGWKSRILFLLVLLVPSAIGGGTLIMQILSNTPPSLWAFVLYGIGVVGVFADIAKKLWSGCGFFEPSAPKTPY